MKAPRCALPVAAIAFLLMAGLAVSSPNQKQPRTQYPLYILTYDHGGIILWGADQFRQSLRSAVSWLDRYPDFKIGLDNEAYAYDELARNYPEILGELKGYLKKYEGRLGIGTSTYGQPLSAFITEESNIRQIELALRTCEERLGVRPRVYLMSEHAMHSQIPQILEGFAFQGAVMRTHFMMYGYNPTFNVPIGWWIGSDESRLPAIPTYEGEGASFGTTTEDNFILNHYPSKQCQVSLEDYRRHFPRIRPLLASRADDAAVRQEGLVAQYSGHPEYQWILLEELFGLFPRPQAALQTGANDFKTRMPWGYCGNWIWNQGREAEVSVLTAERLAALSWLAGDQSRERRIEEAWKNVLTAQHHDIQICGLLQDADRFLTDSLAASSEVKNASLVFLAGRMGNGGLVQVNVFNPMSWARKEWITARITIRKKAAEGVVVRKGESRLPTLLLADAAVAGSSDRDCLVAFQAEVPGLAVTSYSIDTDPSPTSGTSGIEVDESQLVIRTPDWNVQLSPGGGVTAWTDRKSGRPVLAAAGKKGLFLTGTINGQEEEAHGTWNLTSAKTGLPLAVAREEGRIGGIPYTLEFTFRSDSPVVSCRLDVDLNEEKIGQISNNPEDAVSAFVHSQKLRVKAFTASRPTKGIRDLPFVIAETSEPSVDGNYWSAAAGSEGGLAFFNKGTMGATVERDGGFSMPLTFAMYYIWGTRMLKGRYHYDFAVHPFLGDWRKHGLHRQALEFNFPMLVSSGSPGTGALGVEIRPVVVNSDSVLLTALYNRNGSVFARVWESQGTSGKATLSYKGKTGQGSEVDLLGTEIRHAPAELTFQPWQFRTVKMR